MTNTLLKTTRFFCLLFLLAFITLSFQQAMAEGAPGVRLDDIMIEVIEADLDMASVPAKNPVYVSDDKEKDIGGYVPLNRDDDNGNDTPERGYSAQKERAQELT